MKEVLKGVGTCFTLEDCERYYSELHLSCIWSDGKDLTLEFEK